MLALCGCEADAIAADIMYHPSCYREFTRSDNLEKLRDTPAESSDGYCDAFLELSEEIQRKVIIGGKVIGMKKLLQTFLSILKSKGVDLRQYRVEKLKRRLRKRFGDDLSIFNPNPSKPAVLFPSSMPVG